MQFIRLACAAALSLSVSAAFATPTYKMASSIPLGGPDRWDYVVFDASSGRVFVAHGDEVTIVDPKADTVIGQIKSIPGGTHGVAISTATGQGFTDDGKNGKVIVFDLKTLKITHEITADLDADAITFDNLTGEVFVIEGDPGAISVVDPKTDSVVAAIKVGEKLEYGVTDDMGTLFVAGEEKGDLVKIDARSHQVVTHWPADGCRSPHGLALDRIGHRLFMGCANSVMMVMSAEDGHVIAKLPIGRGNDAVTFDSRRQRVFSSNGIDGTVSVYQQVAPDNYVAQAPITTRVSGRTMAVDPKSGRLFVAAAETDPAASPGGRPQVRPGTLKLMILQPIE